MIDMAKRPYRRYDQSPDDEDGYLVYWVYDRRCTSPERDGYIGCTSSAKRQIPRAMERFNVTQFRILFRGTQDECLAVESKLRPRPGIGWNIAAGGSRYGNGLADVPKPITQRERMADTATSRYADRKPRSESYERQRLAKNAKRAAARAAGLPRQY
jgi:hypothetical protein